MMANKVTDLLRQARTSDGRSVFELSLNNKVLLVFLRHFGCTFCREALATLAGLRGRIEDAGAQIVLVHLAQPNTAAQFFKGYNLQDLACISDPEAYFYEGFGLTKGTFNQLFGLRVLLRTVDSAFIKGHGGWRTIGDGFQMPGVFLIRDGEVKDQFIHRFISDKPDYLGMVTNS